MKHLRLALVMGVTLACAPAEGPPAAEAPAAAAEDCAPIGDLNFLCGAAAPEDLVPVPGTPWLLASGMEPGSGLHVVDTAAKSLAAVFPDGFAVRPDVASFASCPGPLDPAVAVLHGLSLRPTTAAGFSALYATNHGGRESVEVFELDATGASPVVTWIGCALMPEGIPANSVAVFGDGTMVATVVTMPGRTMEELFTGAATGAVFRWTPGAERFEELPGTSLAGNNGIETSPADDVFYVAASGGREVVAFTRADAPEMLWRAALDGFAPDNVRLVGDRLIAAGMADDEPSCGGPPTDPAGIQCPRGYIAAAVDPATGAVTEIARGPVAAPYTGTATAIPVGDEIWLSSFNTDRVAWRTLAP